MFKPVTLQTNALPGSFMPAGFRFAHPQTSKKRIEMSSSNFTFWELIESVFIFAALLRQASFGFLPAFLTRAFAFARNIHMNCIYLPFMRICLCGSDGFFHDVPLRVSSSLSFAGSPFLCPCQIPLTLVGVHQTIWPAHLPELDFGMHLVLHSA